MFPSCKSPFWVLLCLYSHQFPSYPTDGFTLLCWLSWSSRSEVPQTCPGPPFSLSMNAICMPKTTKLVFSPDLFSGSYTHISTACLTFFILLFNWNLSLNINKTQLLIFCPSPTSVNGTHHSLNCQSPESLESLTAFSYVPQTIHQQVLYLTQTSNASMLLTFSLLWSF